MLNLSENYDWTMNKRKKSPLCNDANTKSVSVHFCQPAKKAIRIDIWPVNSSGASVKSMLFQQAAGRHHQGCTRAPPGPRLPPAFGKVGKKIFIFWPGASHVADRHGLGGTLVHPWRHLPTCPPPGRACPPPLGASYFSRRHPMSWQVKYLFLLLS